MRRRREAMRVGDVGLPAGALRRTPGLRREEIAGLANISANYYERIEQGRGVRPSEQLIGSLARALRLDLDDLLAASPEFAALWEQGEVGVQRSTRKTVIQL